MKIGKLIYKTHQIRLWLGFCPRPIGELTVPPSWI